MSVVVPKCRYSGSIFSLGSFTRRCAISESRYFNSFGNGLGCHSLTDLMTLSNADIYAGERSTFPVTSSTLPTIRKVSPHRAFQHSGTLGGNHGAMQMEWRGLRPRNESPYGDV